ncbi:hypothetical protein BO82DRAFT_398660 [Aspergillus uvarum CBS 121591]|uniref:NAD(P)-binding domain-containing protein n=1 Tax=Aspergillus uvarum CBS 121591 TaxID=1448315 RepID=A0A319CHG3_9EURO|nr:hypothetical protein BO82DRAFT_398660 [Aspergillus uvarum CBS 121591]PYH85226.1 hypothetical protein BO82DRAFT_398660 [Aspergillus uvarum CBS 121591]
MTPKVLITGVTGFEKGALVQQAYPQVRLVHGTTDDVDLLEEEASAADIVFHSAGSDEHVPPRRQGVCFLTPRETERITPGFHHWLRVTKISWGLRTDGNAAHRPQGLSAGTPPHARSDSARPLARIIL